MRAIIVREFGGPANLVLEQVPRPVPGLHEVLVEVEFAGVNFTDVRNRIGDGLAKLPFTPGVEVSGVVCEVGPAVTGFAVGDRVAAFSRGHGYAEYVVAAEAFTVRLPQQLWGDPASGGLLVTIPLALNVVQRAARIQPGESVLLHAAAGGVGAIVGQLLSKVAGVRLFGTVSTVAKFDFAQRHGFAEVMTYDQFPNVIDELTGGRGVDVVLDPVGGEVQAKSLALLAPFGRLVSYSNISRDVQSLPDAEWLRARCIGFIGLSNGQLSALAPEILRLTLERSVELVASGALEVAVTGEFPLEQVALAHQAFAERTATGKFIIRM